MSKSNSRIQKVLASSFISIITTIILLLICEYVARAIHWQPFPVQDFDFDTRKKPHPYTMFRGVNWDEKLNINSFGYRGKEPKPDRNNKRVKIFFLGGSTSYVGQVPVPERLEKILNTKLSEKIDVFNWALPSTKSGEELSRIIFEIVDFEPDLIIAYNGANDFGETRGDPRPGYPYNFITIENNPLTLNVEEYPLLDLTLYGSFFLRQLFKNYFVQSFLELDKLRKDEGFKSDEWVEKTTFSYVQNITKMHKISLSYGYPMHVFLQPMKSFVELTNRFQTTNYLPKAPYNELQGSEIKARYIFRTKFLPNLKTKMRFHDISDLFKDFNKDDVFIDWCHINEEYRENVANSIYEKIKDDIKKILKQKNI